MISKINNRINLIKKRRIRKQKINALLSRSYDGNYDILNIWPVSYLKLKKEDVVTVYDSYTIFGTTISLETINWHKDYVSGFEYPQDRFDKINISRWFNKGIDIKFPWEVSRFYFAIPLAQNYLISGDEKYYQRLKDLITDWIDKNPFLYGVNWHCTMEVAIRAANWVVAGALVRDRLLQDTGFYKKFAQSLIQHAYYIHAFPEIKSNGTGNNHLIADYAGLLFLAAALREHREAEKWQKTSVDGLIRCMETQVHDDGTSFEGSIPYHRLVLEMFGYTAVLCRVHNIELPSSYYERLFKMFEFTAAYMDHNGNASQIGDNDSGRFIKFYDYDEHDHSYLLDIGETLFNYVFKSQLSKRNPGSKNWLPYIEKINIIFNRASQN